MQTLFLVNSYKLANILIKLVNSWSY